MRFTQVTINSTHVVHSLNSTHVVHSFVRNEQALDLDQPTLGTDLHIHDQADAVIQHKQACDTWEARYAERTCGCAQCRHAYREMLVFYATLGTEQPARERVRTGGLAWYTTQAGGSQLERR